jgi:DNA mismatch repair protein MutS
MNFSSILFEKPDDGRKGDSFQAFTCFIDLNLDQIINTITASKEEYNLKPFFYLLLKDSNAITYRHQIFQELENVSLLEHAKNFAQKMQTMRESLAQSRKIRFKYQKESWFLDAVEIYCDAINSFAHALSLMELRSRGFLSFRDYLINYAKSESFTSLLAETKTLKEDLCNIRYRLLILDNSFKVSKYEPEIDYSDEVEKTFEKFKEGAVKDYKIKFSDPVEMNHIEEIILNFVAQLYPGIFLHLDRYSEQNLNYMNETISTFDREIQFYLAYLEYISRFKQTGLKMCYPKVSNASKEVYNEEGFDLALADRLISEHSTVVCNDFYLKNKERIFVISGPNQGGKTTFARTFGQLHYLANLGCPVPGSQAQLFLFDRLFTHFEKEENIKNLRGKLEDDLFRIHEILKQATSNSMIIMNEIFTSTTLQDAIFLSKKLMEKIIELDLLCVCVTFIDELSSLSEKTVSMVSTVIPENPSKRTFKIIRKPADGLSYALSIAEKYHLTYHSLKERIQS